MTLTNDLIAPIGRAQGKDPRGISVPLADAMRPLDDPVEIQQLAARILGQALGASRVNYFEVTGETVSVTADYTDGVASVVGRYRLDDFGSAMIRELRAEGVAIAEDVRSDPRFGPDERAIYDSLQVLSHATVALVKDGALVGGISVNHTRPRDWPDADVALLRDVADRTREAVQRARAESDLRVSEERYRTLFDSIDEGYCLCELILDAAGTPADYRFLEVNPHFSEMTGIQPEAIGRTARELVPGLEDSWVETYGRVVLTGEPTRFQQGSAAMARQFDVYVTRVGGPGSLLFAIVFNDVTQRAQAEGALHEREVELEAELAATRQLNLVATQMIEQGDPAALYERILDAATTIMRSQFASLQLLHQADGEPECLELIAHRGFSEEAALHWAQIRHDTATTCGMALEQRKRVLVTDVDEDAGLRDEYRPRGIRSVQTTPLVSRSGELLGAMSTHWAEPHEPRPNELRLFDVLARQAADFLDRSRARVTTERAEAQVRDREERMRLALSAGAMGSFTWYPQDDSCEADPPMLALFGLVPGQELNLAVAMAQLIHPDDSTAYAAAVGDALDPAGDGVLQEEIRVIWPPGSERWVLVQGQVAFAGQPREPTRMHGVAMDITEAKTAEQELRRALNAKDEFLGLVSHELRTPITTILGNAEVLQRQGDVIAPAARAIALHDIRTYAERLNRIVDDLLTLARAERGMIEPEPIVLGRVVAQIVNEFSRDASARHVAVAAPGEALVVNGDAGVLSQILRNYLSNAQKYGDGSGIEVIVGARDGTAEVRVLDRGIGIDAENPADLFDAFYRAESVAHVGGLGIGLSVCKRLAEALGGRVWAAPREGGGSEFGLALALYDDEAGAA